jgi:hypothetical protein
MIAVHFHFHIPGKTIEDLVDGIIQSNVKAMFAEGSQDCNSLFGSRSINKKPCSTCYRVVVYIQ